MKKKEANPFRIGRERWSSNLLAPIDWRQKRSASFAVFTSITPVASAERTKKNPKNSIASLAGSHGRRHHLAGNQRKQMQSRIFGGQ